MIKNSGLFKYLTIISLLLVILISTVYLGRMPIVLSKVDIVLAFFGLRYRSLSSIARFDKNNYQIIKYQNIEKLVEVEKEQEESIDSIDENDALTGDCFSAEYECSSYSNKEKQMYSSNKGGKYKNLNKKLLYEIQNPAISNKTSPTEEQCLANITEQSNNPNISEIRNIISEVSVDLSNGDITRLLQYLSCLLSGEIFPLNYLFYNSKGLRGKCLYICTVIDHFRAIKPGVQGRLFITIIIEKLKEIQLEQIESNNSRHEDPDVPGTRNFHVDRPEDLIASDDFIPMHLLNRTRNLPNESWRSILNVPERITLN